MYALVMLTALAAPGQVVHPCWCGPHGFGFGVGGYAHGYGSFFQLTRDAGGVVLPPAWSSDPISWCEYATWFGYVSQLDGQERAEMIRVWERATPEARRALLARLPALAAEAAEASARIEIERAKERYRVENRPLSEEEAQVFERYYLTLRGVARKYARDRWLDTDNRGRRIYLKEIIRELQLQEREREDKNDFEEELELQKEREKKEKDEKDRKDKEDRAKKAKEAKDKKAKEDKDKKDKDAKDKKDKEDKDKKDKKQDDEDKDARARQLPRSDRAARR